MAADAAPAFVLIERLPAPGEEVLLDGDAAHYLSRVVRARPGERVHATDGAGTVATLEVVESRPDVRVIGGERRVMARPAERVLVCGAPEGDRADWMVEKLAELGVSRLVLAECERAKWERAEAKLERWSRLAAAALRQSQSAWLMRIEPPRPLAEALAGAESATARWVALPGAATVRLPREDGASWCVIGPSPGFSESEVKRLRESGFVPAGLGPARLRTETAALTVAALWQAGGAG
ncbi:MAG: 16S rRNA (uracil(1498)-N(3))-methyltransferase [Candidatus Eisenbacteria bacterium]|uniref:Ribosomal RNA small subunit methyltransferase E n=1 Tax=Eiseniibacteriota bacterium TaxID=2212470 RepID=A0A933W9Z6_UNCEI|nr:16S rRNA (uracil(1498)-N(3))-methyltransferase [Candidatus Eisenbacteria bacterium]